MQIRETNTCTMFSLKTHLKQSMILIITNQLHNGSRRNTSK